MKIYVKYRLKRICVPMFIMSCVVFMICAKIICTDTSANGYELEVSTFFMENITEALNKAFPALIILSACMGFASMQYCSSDTEKFLPYKSGARYLISYLTGFLFLVVYFLFISLSVVICYINKSADYRRIYMMSWDYSPENIIMLIFNIFLVCIAIYTVFGTAVIITEYGLLSMAVAVSVLIFPEYFMAVLKILSRYTLFTEERFYNFRVLDVAGAMDLSDGNTVYTGNRAGNCLGMLIITAVFFSIGYAALKMAGRTSGRFTISAVFDWYIIFISGIYIAFLVPLMNGMNKKPLAVEVFMMAIIFAITELFMIKSLLKGRKYDYLNPGCGNNG